MDLVAEKKATHVTLLDLRGVSIIADYFLICNGENERQLKALSAAITESAKQGGDAIPLGAEGDPGSGWLLIDFGDLVVHLFSPAQRNYYRLEDIWNQSRIVIKIQ